MPRAFQKIIGDDRHIVLVEDGGTVGLVYVEEEARVCVYRPRQHGQWDALYFDLEGELLGQKVAPFSDAMLETLGRVVRTGDVIVDGRFVGWLMEMARRGKN